MLNKGNTLTITLDNPSAIYYPYQFLSGKLKFIKLWRISHIN